MRKASAWVIPAIIIVIALVLVYFLQVDHGEDVIYSSKTTGHRGTSLLADTLRHMGYTVRPSYNPLTRYTNSNNVYIIIQPRNPAVTATMADEMLEWVHSGGRLVFLCRNFPRTVIDVALDSSPRYAGDFLHYRHGAGEILTGSASFVTNYNLMNNHIHGHVIQTTFDLRNTTVFFGEYYHGFHTQETFIGQLPLVVQLLLAQMIIFSFVIIWHLGKRFGNPVGFYDEVEREENEYVRALARLYMASDRKRRRKKKSKR
ncbi:MAG: DUF4350 domain-containing protein [Defluviitaleaceae bacterium]|nr:DUF4350 domain-containing protein [Defluviitaleaceae bacterium]